MLKRAKSKYDLRSNTRSNRHDQGDPKSAIVRYDYSATYLENDDLEAELQDTRYSLQRRKVRASIEGEESLKTIKLNADKLLSLKDKVNARVPHESANKISTVHVPVHQRNSHYQKTSTSTSELPSVNTNTLADTNGAINEIQNESNKGINRTAQKAVSNLTMFALALRNFRALRTRHNRLEQDETDGGSDKDISDTNKRHADMKTETNHSNPLHNMNTLSNFKRGGEVKRRPATVPANSRRRLSIASSGLTENVPSGQTYGINVQKDFTRSRRKLAELSKLDMDLKYKYENKFEARRQRLLADCKDNVELNERIRKFLKDIDEFKKLDKPVSALDKVLKRSKSAFIFRDKDK